MIKLESFTISDSKNMITYSYHIPEKFKRYFATEFYIDFKEEIDSVPPSILTIPAISNLVVICWFLDCDFFSEEIDLVLYNSLLNMQKEFKIMYPQITDRNVIKFNSLTQESTTSFSKSTVLFSGGVDAFATLFRHYDEEPILIKVFGEKMDNKSVEEAIKEEKKYNEEIILFNNEKKYIISNLRTFYSDKLNKLPTQGGWWSHVQHGFGLTTLLAPLSFKYKISKVYIASSYTDSIKIVWGSTPQVDNKIAWSGTGVIHDGYELERQDKIDLISNFTKNRNENIILRVCYSPINKYTNCSKCEKCKRTILGLILNNANPMNFGFKLNPMFYDELKVDLKKGFKSEGVQYFWKEIYNKILSTKEIFYISEDHDLEDKKLVEIRNILKLKTIEDIPVASQMTELKKKVISISPKLFDIYLNIRYSLLKRKL